MDFDPAQEFSVKQLQFNCPPTLAQHFWLLCKVREETPGAALRAFMEREVDRACLEGEFDPYDFLIEHARPSPDRQGS